MIKNQNATGMDTCKMSTVLIEKGKAKENESTS